MAKDLVTDYLTGNQMLLDRKEMQVFQQQQSTTTKGVGGGGGTSTGMKPATKVVANSGDPGGADYFTSSGTGIQEAIDAVANSGGGSVYIKAGTYTVATPIKVKDNIVLRGDGMATHLKLADGVNTELIIGYDLVTGHSNVVIESLQIDGNDANQSSAVSGISLDNFRNTIIRACYIHDCKQDGLKFNGSLSERITITENVFYDNTENGMSLRDSLLRVLIDTNHAYNNGKSNIAIHGDGTYVTISNNTCKHSGYSTLADNITGYSTLNDHITVTGNQCYDSANHGIHVGGDHLIVSNNQVELAQFEGIRIETQSGGATPCNDVVVSGNTVKSVRHGIYLINVNQATVSANTVESMSQTGIITDTTSDAQINSNSIIGTETNLDGMRIDKSSRITIMGNTSKNNGRRGLYISDDGITVSQFITIIGNNFYDDSGYIAQQQAVFTDGSSDYIVMQGNIMRAADHIFGSYILTNSNNQISGNFE